MKTIRLLVSVFLFVAVIGILLPSAKADQWNKRTKVTFTEPVQIPGTVLQPGTYWFKLLDSSSNRNIVVITNEAEDHVFAIVLAIPNHRLTPTENTAIGFWETPRQTPNAMRSWFYPGDNFGQEFAYPKQTAEKLAAEEHAPVPAVPEEIAPKMVEPKEEAPAISELKAAPFEMITPPAEVAQVPKPAEEEKLPQTASPLPLLGLLGTLFASGGILLNVLRRR